MKKFLFIFLILAGVYSYSQPWTAYLPAKKDGSYTLFDYQKAFNTYVEKTEKNFDAEKFESFEDEDFGIPGYSQFKRWEWYWEPRVNPKTGEFPEKSAWEVWQEYKKTHNVKSVGGTWVSRGDAYLDPIDGGSIQESGTGRLNCAHFDPNDDNHFWVGAPAGGLWETTDGGNTWTCLTDNNPVLGVSDIAIPPDYDKNTNPTIYIATGDRDAGDDPSIGVLKTTDGGATWTQTGLTFEAKSGARIGRIIINPNNKDIIWAATSLGLYKSTDAGDTWTFVQGGNFIDMELIPGSTSSGAGTLIATTYGWTPKVYRSTDGGDTWTNTWTATSNEFRCDVAVTPANTNVVYIITADGSNNMALYGLYKSTDQGVTFTLVFSGSSDNNLYGWGENNSASDGGQGWYDVALAVSTTDENLVYVGGVNGFVSTNGGNSFTLCNEWDSSVGSADVIHADHHNAYFRLSDDRLFDVNDGGFYYSDNVNLGKSSTWTSITDGLVTGQIYDIGVAQDNDNEFITGFQDNGTKLVKTNSTDFDQVIGGDGMCCAINPTDRSIQYGTYAQMRVYKSTNEGGSFSVIRNSGSAAWAGPVEADPQGGEVYIGDDRVKQYSGYSTSWNNLSQSLDASDYLRVLAIYNDGTDKMIWTASPNGCWKSPLGGGSGSGYTAISGLPPDQVTDIDIDDDDYNHVYVCFGGYDNYNVYETTDGGNTWTDISEGLPPVPCGAIVINEQNTSQNEVYVGTDAGIYVKLGDAPWQLFNDGMPFVSITDLEIYYDNANPANTKIYASTYGRGIWSSDCYEPPALDACISSITVPADEYCDLADITPTVVLSNIGTTTLTSADVSYTLDGGSPVTVNWSGSLAQGQSTTITFPSITLTYGSHDFSATVSNTNGTTDDNPDNDTKQKTFDVWNNSLPYTQTFDNFTPNIGYAGTAVELEECWTNETSESNLDWSVTQGETPSSGTGPSGDHTSGNGRYLYTEVSGISSATPVQVYSPVFDLSSFTNCQVSFWYNMNGSDCGSLQIDLYYGGSWHNGITANWDGTNGTSVSGDQGTDWHQVVADISAADGDNNVQVRISSTTGTSYRGDIAIDDFNITGTPTAISWTGNVNTDWQNTGNWDGGSIPTATDDVIIPNGCPNYPVVDDGISTVAQCKDMTIESSASLTVAPNGYITVNGTLTNNAGTSGITIQSDATGTGSLIQNSAVDATVSRYLDATTRAWHMLGSPITAAPVSVFPTTANLYYYDETTDDYWTGNNYDAGSTMGWTAFTSGNMTPEQGYLFNYSATTLTFSGTLNSGDQSYTLSYTDHGGTAPNGTSYNDFDGWNLVSNPFTSAIDWTAVDANAAKLYDAIYVWDGANATYKSWVNGTDSPDGLGTNGGSQYIPAMQGFFVKFNESLGTSGTLTIPTTAKVHNAQAFWKNSDENITDILRLDVTANDYTDETVIRLKDNATEGMDDHLDAYKLFSYVPDAPQIYTVNSNHTEFSINTLPYSDQPFSVPLRIYTNAADFTVSVENINFENYDLYLIDNGVNGNVNRSLNLTGESSFEFSTLGNEMQDRFEILFVPKSVANLITQNLGLVVYPNPSEGIINIMTAENQTYKIDVMSPDGKIVEHTESKDRYTRIDLSGNPKGIYIVRVYNDEFDKTIKLVLK